MTDAVTHSTSHRLSPEQLERLLEISTRLGSTLYLDELLSQVMDVATELTNTVAASILLLDERSGQLRFAASTGNLMPETLTVPLDQSIAGWVLQNGRYLIVDDVQADERFYALVDQRTQFQTETMLAVPLPSADKVIGVLEVINKRGNLPYTKQDVALMQALASQAAVAITNARLFEQFDLLAEVMHELKTPMMAIYSAAELLSRPELPEDKRQTVVQMIKRESGRLSEMARDHLDLARLESRRLRMEQQAVALVPLIEEVVEIARSQAAERNIEIVTMLAADLPPAGDQMLWGDADRLKQALLNLVSNGIKYNKEHGRIVIEAACENGRVQLSVSDTGYGIAPQETRHLFDRFYRSPGSEKAAEGSGLGLAIAHKIIEQHRGEITVHSIPQQGTTFMVQLPLAPASDHNSPPSSLPT